MFSSVYERVLGAEFASLDPGLQRYFGPIPVGSVGIGRGVFDVAGSRLTILRPLLTVLSSRHVLFPEFGRDVPFTVINTPGMRGTLSAARTFTFSRTNRVMEDTMAVVDGCLVDRLGRRRGLEVPLDVWVHDGGLRMASRRCRLRIAGIRIPLPRRISVTLDERTDPTRPDRQRVDVRIRVPGLGEVFRYSGSFTYRLERVRV